MGSHFYCFVTVLVSVIRSKCCIVWPIACRPIVSSSVIMGIAFLYLRLINLRVELELRWDIAFFIRIYLNCYYFLLSIIKVNISCIIKFIIFIFKNILIFFKKLVCYCVCNFYYFLISVAFKNDRVCRVVLRILNAQSTIRIINHVDSWITWCS